MDKNKSPDGVEVLGGADRFSFDPIRRDTALCNGGCDILLTPYDLYRLSKKTGVNPVEFFLTRCWACVEGKPGIPVLRLHFEDNGRCPLWGDAGGCMAQDSAPELCALFPLNRFVHKDEANGINEIRYFAESAIVDGGEEHTVEQWLAQAGTAEYEKAYRAWVDANDRMHLAFTRIDGKYSTEELDSICRTVYAALYMNYDTKAAFLSQFEENLQRLNVYLASL